MGDWIRVDADFGVPGVHFRIGQGQLLILRNRGILNIDVTQPHKYEAELTRLIEMCRPDLTGGCLISISVRFMWMEMFFVHPNLPRRQSDMGNFPVVDLDDALADIS